MKPTVLLVGAGPMAIEYAKVLRAIEVNFIVIGKGEENAKLLKEQTGIDVLTGGLEKYVQNKPQLPEYAIVAVSENMLGSATTTLINSGVKNILVEKPGGLDITDIKNVCNKADENNASVFVGYNRRFYASVRKAREIILQDGGVVSFNFEFTEWSHLIKDLKKENGVLENWFLHNSTHIIDLAFYLGGLPQELVCYSSGGFPWHPKASIYSGAGISVNMALFSYQANWESPGRWGVEILTKKHRLIFRPIEKLQIQEIGSVAINPVEIDAELDVKFKPGIYHQTKAFINKDANDFISIQQQLDIVAKFYKKIGNL